METKTKVLTEDDHAHNQEDFNAPNYGSKIDQAKRVRESFERSKLLKIQAIVQLSQEIVEIEQKCVYWGNKIFTLDQLQKEQETTHVD